MYSVVMLAALTAGEQAPSFHHKGYHWNGGYGACYGGCYGVGYHGWGGWGQPYGGYGWPGYSGWGGCGGYASAAYGVPMTPLVTPPPPMPPASDKDGEDRDGKAKEKGKGKGMGDENDTSAKARVTFLVPEGAKVYVDGRLLNRVAETRTFRTPPLAKGEAYFYEVRAEVIRDGKPVSETRRIIVRAGAEVRADFRAVGADTSAVAVRK
jgi:uncharacterized protein (TIGR03000 family)